jgi:hypothetical protein
MAASKLWASDTAEPWAAVQQNLNNVWQDNANERLQELNRCIEVLQATMFGSDGAEGSCGAAAGADP